MTMTSDARQEHTAALEEAARAKRDAEVADAAYIEARRNVRAAMQAQEQARAAQVQATARAEEAVQRYRRASQALMEAETRGSR